MLAEVPKTDDQLPPYAAGLMITIDCLKEGRDGAKRYSLDEIIGRLREAEVTLAERALVGEVCRLIGVTEVTNYRWLKEYGRMRVAMLGV